ncbi:DUF3822 family protein [Niabella ginsengisoli]|uniref:DUF3822 family protein n=1 Tax=Niabella ginsengisoli TaxID=522298 RepID=A0ABS9SIK5_9BACT|nr:DUF3822 family protein [Niabella ginsengisoli]MCH5598146.1 DUF3822 family protein [Niabella ginsengisoli]
MQEQFNISTQEEVVPQETHLAIQVGGNYMSFCIYSPDEKRLLQLKRYGLKSLSTENLDEIIARNLMLQGSFERIVTALDFGFNTLLPAEMDDADTTALMYLEHADQQDHVITERIPKRDITNIYTVPPNVLTWMVGNFPSSAYLHAHTVQIASVTNAPETGLLKVNFSESMFTVVAFKNDTILLAKTYQYKSPADVVFYLLKICEVFGFVQQQVALQLSGLIDVSSRLYKEIYDYFLDTSLKQADWIDNTSETPSHYFTSLNELAVCELFQEV